MSSKAVSYERKQKGLPAGRSFFVVESGRRGDELRQSLNRQKSQVFNKWIFVQSTTKKRKRVTKCWDWLIF
jgi:hypothetical protein